MHFKVQRMEKTRILNRASEEGGLVFWLPFRASAVEKAMVFENRFEIRMDVVEVNIKRGQKNINVP